MEAAARMYIHTYLEGTSKVRIECGYWVLTNLEGVRSLIGFCGRNPLTGLLLFHYHLDCFSSHSRVSGVCVFPAI
jgi:hypothetical protein